jgi:hypothetical protein
MFHQESRQADARDRARNRPMPSRLLVQGPHFLVQVLASSPLSPANAHLALATLSASDAPQATETFMHQIIAVFG